MFNQAGTLYGVSMTQHLDRTVIRRLTALQNQLIQFRRTRELSTVHCHHHQLKAHLVTHPLIHNNLATVVYSSPQYQIRCQEVISPAYLQLDYHHLQ